jgi:hypothetical protein
MISFLRCSLIASLRWNSCISCSHFDLAAGSLACSRLSGGGNGVHGPHGQGMLTILMKALVNSSSSWAPCCWALSLSSVVLIEVSGVAGLFINFITRCVQLTAANPKRADGEIPRFVCCCTPNGSSIRLRGSPFTHSRIR